jgi:hypothetical protein
MAPAIEPVAVSTPHMMRRLEGTARFAPGVVAPWRVMLKLTALDRIVGVVATQADAIPAPDTARFSSPTRHLMGAENVRASEREAGPTITAVLEGGPVGGRRIEVSIVEGRPPKTIDLHADDGSTCRYCLADWVQTGPSAVYAFLYRV